VFIYASARMCWHELLQSEVIDSSERSRWLVYTVHHAVVDFHTVHIHILRLFSSSAICIYSGDPASMAQCQ